ncbi:3-phosphoglycerate dehydrogenase [Dorea longicatena]|nr:3-phosphoglycerate dehydrogenase [Clostridium sp.]RGC63017.1 3-phosphoglycerate dehydrogenase [Dorea longicatena]
MKNVLVAGSYSPDVKEKIMNLLGGHFNLYFASRQEELLEHPETDYVILRILRMNEKEMDAMPSLKFIQRWGAGVDTVDIKAAGKRGIVVANIAGGNAPAVAEQAVNLMLATLRNTAFIDKNIRDGKWIKSSIEGRSYMLKGKKVGLLGAGNIGRRVAGIVQAFGAEVQYYDIFPLTEDLEEKLAMRYVSLETLMKTSDVISIHIPKTDGTYHMIGKAQLESMKPTAVIINTARGGIIDEDALYEQLKDGKLLAAGMDCFENEPVSAENRLLSLDNVTLSCHVGGNTSDIGLVMADRVKENVESFDSGKLNPDAVVNRQFLC